MAVRSFLTNHVSVYILFVSFYYFNRVVCQTSSIYQLDSEYSGNNFFDGWDFYTVSVAFVEERTVAHWYRGAIPPVDLLREYIS